MCHHEWLPDVLLRGEFGIRGGKKCNICYTLYINASTSHDIAPSGGYTHVELEVFLHSFIEEGHKMWLKALETSKLALALSLFIYL